VTGVLSSAATQRRGFFMVVGRVLSGSVMRVAVLPSERIISFESFDKVGFTPQ
jgi:hypothetical protein